MSSTDLIRADQFCSNHQIDLSFITSLQKYELITATVQDGSIFIPAEELKKLEKMVRLHYDLAINIEGIEAITHLLKRVENLQQEIMHLKNCLLRYE
ncbi:MAG: chaperone modulator CbpM [Chitinophagales bacterium]|nr:chaperone modulator CbpM [Chitinophagales bacterium]